MPTPPRSPFQRFLDLDTPALRLDSDGFRELANSTARHDALLGSVGALSRQIARDSPLAAARAATEPFTNVVASLKSAIDLIGFRSPIESSLFDAARDQLLATDALVRSARSDISHVLRDSPQVGDAIQAMSWIGDALERASALQRGGVLQQFDTSVQRAREAFKLGSALGDSIVGIALESFDRGDVVNVVARATDQADRFREVLDSLRSRPEVTTLVAEHEKALDALRWVVLDDESDHAFDATVKVHTSPMSSALGGPTIRSRRPKLLETIKSMSPEAQQFYLVAVLSLFVTLLQAVLQLSDSSEEEHKALTQQIAALTDVLAALEARPPVVATKDMTIKRSKGEGGTRCIAPAGTAFRVMDKSGRWVRVELVDAETGKPVEGWVLKHHLRGCQ